MSDESQSKKAQPSGNARNRSSAGKLSVGRAVLLQFSVVFVAVVFLVCFMVMSIMRIDRTKEEVSFYNSEINTLNAAGLAHYKWANDLMHHINTGETFAGGLDPTACSFGLYMYGDRTASPEYVRTFLNKVEPYHNSIHAVGVNISDFDIMEALSYEEKVEVETSRAYANDVLMLENPEAAQKILYQIDLELADYTRQHKINIYVNDVEASVAALMAEVYATIDMAGESIEAAEASLEKVITTSLITCSAVALFVILAIIHALLYIKKEITDPVAFLQSGSTQLSEGNLSANFVVESKTKEVTDLSIALETSTKKLKYIIGDIGDKVGSMSHKDFSIYPDMNYPGDFRAVEESVAELIDVIRETMAEIQTSATQVTTGSEQVSSGAQALAHGTIEQTGSVDQLCHVVADVTTKVEETSNNAAEADKLGQVAVKVVEQSTNEMSQLMGAIEEIQQSSSYIEKIIHTIDDIAFQTNILALNAAVEAARAGQAGRGFAVVADEVRNLAQKSAEAAQNTTALIETSLRAVERGTELANSTNATFEEVVKNTEQVLGVVAEIAKATQEQMVGIDSISTSVGQISAVVQTNSATSEESAAASEELSSQANTMKVLISEFKL